MVIRLQTTCPILRLPLRAIHHQLRGATAMERVPHTTLSLMPDHHRAILATLKATPKGTPKATPKGTPNNRSINSSTVGSLSLLMDMAVQVMMPQLSRSMLRTKATATATAKDTNISHQTGIHSMTAIKRNISSLAWHSAQFQKLFGIDVCVRRCIHAFVQVVFISGDVHSVPEKI